MSSSSALVLVLAPKVESTLSHEAKNVSVLCLPAIQPLLLGLGLAVDLEEGEQLLHQSLA